jgi:hypothetical protein
VRLAFGDRLAGRVTEVHGITRILYRVYVPLEPEPLITEVREEEIEGA